MKLRLINFRSYKDRTFNLKHGVTLIKGESGAGKTTIFEAIDYVLYGKVQKPYSHGTKKCSVELTLTAAVTITRRSGPGHLSLKTEDSKYEGGEAQAIITDLFGERSDFITSNYMKQDSRCSLLTGTNAEKLAAIRTVSFKNDDVSDAQDRIKTALKDAKTVSSDASSTFAIAQAALKRFDTMYPNVLEHDFDLDGVSTSDLEAEKNTKSDSLKEMRTKMENVIRIEATVASLESITLDEVDVSGVDEKISAIETDIKETQNKLEKLIANKAKISALSDMSSMREKKQKEIQKITKELEELSENINTENLDDDIERLEKNKRAIDTCNAIFKSLGVKDQFDLNKQSGEIQSEIKEALRQVNAIDSSVTNIKWNAYQQSILRCPKCEAGLVFNGSVLQANDSDFKPEIRAVTIPDATNSMLITAREKHTRLHARKEAFNDANKKISAAMRSKGKSRDGDDQKLIQSIKYKNLQPKLVSLQEDFDSMGGTTDFNSEKSTDEINKQIKGLREKLKSLKTAKDQHESILQKKKSNEKHIVKLDEARKSLGDQKSSSLSSEIEKIEEEIRILTSKIDICKRSVEREELSQAFNDSKEKLDEVAGKAQALSSLYEKSKQIERQVLQDTVVSLNLELKKYLDVMFKDDPITIEFKTTKDLKTGKKAKSMTCSTTIFYKDHLYDDPKQLSGGEKHRLSLAMMLAIGSLTGSNMILLDETLHPLHESLKLSILEFFKTSFGSTKICAIIEHEANEGAYDHVIDLSK